MWPEGLAAPRQVESSQIRDKTGVSCFGKWILYHWAIWEAPSFLSTMPLILPWLALRPPALWDPVLNLHPVTFSEVLSRWGFQDRCGPPDQLLLVQQNNKVMTHCTPAQNYSRWHQPGLLSRNFTALLNSLNASLGAQDIGEEKFK